MSDDFMPMGMPPVMVAYEDFSLFMAQEDRIKQLRSNQAVLLEALDKIVIKANNECGIPRWKEIEPKDAYDIDDALTECRDIAQQAIEAVKE